MSERLTPLAARPAPLPAWLDDDEPNLVGRYSALPAWLEDGPKPDGADLAAARPVAVLQSWGPIEIEPELPELPLPAAPVPVEPPTNPRTSTYRAAAPAQRRWPEFLPRRSLGRLRGWRLPRFFDLIRAGAIASGTALAVAVAFVAPAAEVKPHLSDDVVRFYSAVDRLSAGSATLIVVDAPADQAASLIPLTETVVRHVRSRDGLPIVVWSSTRSREGFQLGGDFTDLGAVGDDVETIRRLGRKDGAGPADSAVRQATGGNPIALAIVVAGDTGTAAKWLGALRPTSNPPGLAIVAGGDPAQIAPVRAAGQAQGVLQAQTDPEGYATMAGTGTNPWQAGGGAQAPVAIAAVGLGAIVILGRLRRRKDDEAE